MHAMRRPPRALVQIEEAGAGNLLKQRLARRGRKKRLMDTCLSWPYPVPALLFQRAAHDLEIARIIRAIGFLQSDCFW